MDLGNNYRNELEISVFLNLLADLNPKQLCILKQNHDSDVIEPSLRCTNMRVPSTSHAALVFL